MDWEHFPIAHNNEVWAENIFLWFGTTRCGLRTFSCGSERDMGWEHFPMAQNNEVWAENIFLWLRTTRYGLRTFPYGSEQRGLGWEQFPMAQNNEVWAENIFLCLRTTSYGLRTFSYVASHLWNSFFKWSRWHCSYWFRWIQASLKYIERSGYFTICDTPPVMTSSAVSGFSLVSVVYWISLSLNLLMINIASSVLWLHICTVYTCTFVTHQHFA